MRISTNDINDYLRCPLYYKLKNVDEIPVGKTLDDYYKDYIKLAIYNYYFSLIEKKQGSMERMVKRWEGLWFTDEMLEMFSEEDLKSKSNEAVITFNSFYDKYGKSKCTPIAVNFGYEAIFEGDENIHVTGTIDLIKVNNDRTMKSETCICFFSLAKQYADQFSIKNDVGITVASHAFRSSFKSKEDKIILEHINCQDDIPTLRAGGDYLRAEKIIRNICVGIKNGVYYPNVNPISCNKCPFKLFCINEKSINGGGGYHARG